MSAEPGPSGESCSTKASPTTPPDESHQDGDLEDHGLTYIQGKYDWTLPGMGEPGEDCGTDALAETEAVCPNGDSVRYTPLRCRRVECPDCYKGEQIERAFRIALEIEARALVREERPHAVVCSVPPEQARTWTYDRLNTALFRRGYRRMKRRCGIDGGYAVFHPWRIPDARKDALRRHGYGSGGDRGGLWEGVREDTLDRGDPRHYVEFSPHVHSLGFPGRIDPHDGDDYLIRKYATLDETVDVVHHVRYLLSHRGDRTGETGRSVRAWGAFHHATDAWDGAEEELAEEPYHALAEEIASMLGMTWSRTEGEIVHDDETECPACGTDTEEFLSMTEVWNASRGRALDGADELGQPWMDRLPADRAEFFEDLADAWWQTIKDRGGAVDLDDFDPPPDLSVFSKRELSDR